MAKIWNWVKWIVRFFWYSLHLTKLTQTLRTDCGPSFFQSMDSMSLKTRYYCSQRWNVFQFKTLVSYLNPSFNNFNMVSVTGEVTRGRMRSKEVILSTRVRRVILKPKLEPVAALGGKELTPWIALRLVFKVNLIRWRTRAWLVIMETSLRRRLY